MDNTQVNITQGLSILEQITRQSYERLENILDHLHGPRPSEAQNATGTPGLMGNLERLASVNQKIERAITQLENVLGTPAAKCMAPMTAQNQIGGIAHNPLAPSRY